MTISRRRQVPLAVSVVLLASFLACEDPIETPLPVADVIFHGGQVHTIERGTVTALAVSGREILAIGSDAVVLQHAGDETVLVDLAGGASLVPGFIDGHTHMIRNAGRQGLTGVDAVEIALRHGLTTLAEVAGRQPHLDTLLAMEAAGDLRVRVVAYGGYNLARPAGPGESRWVETWYPAHPPLVDPDRLLRIAGIKVFVDGAFGNNRGCYAMSDPYPEAFQNDPSFPCPDPRGSLFLTGDELADIIVNAERAGFLVAMHVIGDRGLDTALAGLERARHRTGNPDPRHQLHHNLLMRPDQMQRYLDGNIPFSVFPNFHSCDDALYVFSFGDRHVWYANIYALAEAGGRAFVESDFNFATHPDVERFFNRPVDPLVNLWALTTHQEIQQGPVCQPEPWLAQHPVSIARALRMYTLGGAEAHGIDDLVGSLVPGKRADLVVLSGNPMAVPADSLPSLRVLMTMVDGTFVYCAGNCPP